MSLDHSIPVRRMKSYTGGQGYVYQYYFVGMRAALANPPEGAATEYIFDVTSDRKTTYAVSILLGGVVLKQWAASHGRALTDAEQYAAVKLRLFEAFDQIENMMAGSRRFAVDSEALERLLTGLGVK